MENNGDSVNNEQRDSDKYHERERVMNKNEGAIVIKERPIDTSKESTATVNKPRPSIEEKAGGGENDEISSVGAPTEAK